MKVDRVDVEPFRSWFLNLRRENLEVFQRPSPVGKAVVRQASFGVRTEKGFDGEAFATWCGLEVGEYRNLLRRLRDKEQRTIDVGVVDRILTHVGCGYLLVLWYPLDWAADLGVSVGDGLGGVDDADQDQQDEACGDGEGDEAKDQDEYLDDVKELVDS